MICFGSMVGPIARYGDPSYGALVEATAGETDPSARLDLYQQAEATLVETDTVVAPLFTAVRAS